MSPAKAAASATATSPDAAVPVRLVVGDEELLVERGVARAVAAAREADPAVEVQRLAASEITAGVLAELVSPSLFAESRVVVLEAAQDANAEVTTLLVDYTKAPTDHVSLVVVHQGGAKGKALLDGLKKQGAAVTDAAKFKPWENDRRADFVRSEIRQAGGRITGDALGQLMEAVGANLRELASAASQLVSDSGGAVDADAVRRFHRGRADVNGFAVAERAVGGDRAGALEALRWALDTGVAHVLIADALADAVRTIARVSAAGRGDPNQLASRLKMPPFKVRKAMSQTRGWDAAGLTRAMALVADVNADVKGAAADPSYALERAVEAIVAARVGTHR